MKVKGLKDKLEKVNAIGMPCTSKEFNDLKDGKTIALSKENAELMSSMGLVKIIENKKIKEK